MKIRTVSARYRRTQPTGGYATLGYEVEYMAELEEGENEADATALLQAIAKRECFRQASEDKASYREDWGAITPPPR